MERQLRNAAEHVRSTLSGGSLTSAAFRAAVMGVAPGDRDAWLDIVLGLDETPDDGPELPRGCVPYVPCAVDVLLRMVEQAAVRPSDVFVDIGSGVGRVAALTHLLTGASAIGIEVQPKLARAARDMAARLNLSRLSLVEGDAAELVDGMTSGSVFFLYCPFSGDRLARAMRGLEGIARKRPIRVCCVDLPLPSCSWLVQVASSSDLDVYRSDEP